MNAIEAGSLFEQVFERAIEAGSLLTRLSEEVNFDDAIEAGSLSTGSPKRST